LNPILFLGAGASKEFEIPLFSEMHESFRKDMRGKHHSSRLKKIRKELETVGFPLDIENYISYARGRMKPRETLLKMNPFVAYFVCRASNFRKDTYAKTFLDDIEDFIYSTLLIQDPYKKERIMHHYDKFFDYLERKYYGGKNFEVDIFTTNYDDSIELYCEERKLSFYDGFNEKSDGFSYFEPQLYRLNDIRLYKLHGSVRLGIVKDNQDNTAVIHSKNWFGIGDPFKGNWSYAERMMVLGYDKDISAEPCFELLGLMKQKLMETKTCIAIGYSFSNEPILNIFNDVLRHRESDFELVVLCDSAEKIKRDKFLNDNRVRTIRTKFSGFGLI